MLNCCPDITETRSAPTGDGRIQILLVDDDRDFVTLASTLLETESERIETVTETSPKAALERIDFDGIDCIVSDYRMPEMDGLEFLETVREEHPDLPFILFTGRGDERIAEQAISAGVSDYIVKDGSAEQYAVSANRIENLVMQYRTRQQALRQQTLDTLTQAVLRTVLSESTRDAIEQGVCDRLVCFDLYSFVRIGERNPKTGEIRARACAGEHGSSDWIPFSVDDEPTSVESEALATGEIRIETDIGSDADPEGWYAAAANRGLTAAVGIPIVHEGLPYGVLGAYTDRPSGFASDEIDVLDMLGKLTAFSIGASERRRGDVSRRIVEIEFAVAETEIPFVEIAETLGCAVRLVQTAHRSDGTTLTQYAIEGASTGQVRELESRFEFEVIRVSERSESEIELSVASSEPWWRELTDRYGASIETASADGDGATLSIELPASADIRSVVDHLEARYPGIEPIARREGTRTEAPIDDLRTRLGEWLTDRQLEVLETAYHAGYYEWPHEASSEEVAEMLGIAQPTFAEHFWTAQRRIVERLLHPDGAGEGTR